MPRSPGPPPPPSFETLLAFLRALAHESRLRMVGLLQGGPRRVKDLAEALQIREPTACHHLACLAAAGVVEKQGDGQAWRLRAGELRRLGRALFDSRRPLAAVVPDPDAWMERVLRNYLEGESLKVIPASRRKRWAVLRWLAGRFDAGRRYREAEVNLVLQRHHWDSATLRRELVGYRMLDRSAGLYWRRPEEEWLRA